MTISPTTEWQDEEASPAVVHKQRFNGTHLRIVLGLLGIVLLVLLRLHSLGEPLEGDEATYSLMARIWSSGGRPYEDLWDNKPIGLFWIYRLGLTLFGYNEDMPRLLSMLPVLAVGGLLIWWLRRSPLPQYALTVLALWPALSVWVPSYANGANAEVFLLPFVFAAFICLDFYVRSRREVLWWAAVFSLTASLLIKQVTLPFLILPFLVLSGSEWKQWQHLLGRLAGLFLIIAASHLGLYLAGGCGPFFFVDQFIANTGYGGGDQGFLSKLGKWLALAVKFPFSRAALPLLPLMLAGIAGWFWTRKKWPRQRWWLWGALAVCSVGAVILPGQISEHYVILILPVILAGAVLFQERLPRLDWQWAFAALCAVYLGALTWHFYLGRTAEEISEWKYGKWFVANRKLGLWLKAKGITGSRIYVEGSNAPVYFYSRNLPASRFHCYYVTGGVGGATVQEMEEDIRAQRPEYLVFLNPQPNLPGLIDWRRQHYTPIITEPVRVFQRRAQTTGPRNDDSP